MDRDDYKVHTSPVFISTEVLDPAPPEPPSADTDTEDSADPVPTSPATTEVSPGEPAAPPHEVLQKIHFHFRLFAHQPPLCSTNYRLTYSSAELVGPNHIDIHVSDAGLSEGRTAKHWKVGLYNWDGMWLDATDGGPDFTPPRIQDVKACQAKLQQNGDFVYDAQSMAPLSGQMYADEGSNLPDGFFGSVVNSTYTVIAVTLSTERRVSKRQWGALRCKNTPAPKSALLKSAKRTGDVILVGGVRSFVFPSSNLLRNLIETEVLWFIPVF